MSPTVQDEGDFPMSITNLTNLEVFFFFNEVDKINLWQHPESISRLTKLRVKVLTTCIATSIGNMTSLVDFELSGNFLSGQIPKVLGLLKDLEQLELYYNQHLSGTIPAELGKLRDMDIRNSKPPWLPHVYIIDLADNDFTGTFPRSIENARNLSELFLQNSKMSGFLPPEISRAVNLVKIDLSNNLLSGSIPSEIGNLKNLNLLLLQYNKLGSSVPSSLSLLKSLNVLDLSNDRLTGKIPESLCELLLSSINFLDQSRFQ
ncbi:hypothetical protein V6N13_120917 [Hibiscus sabdariffa]|uniref:Uncharacterized protein n=1 Tax=Hibiscus sabdariffa TaxID=183260 RepID=A0ABR2E676_9ROSI